MEENKIELIPISNLAGKNFVIDGYQRGYKWGKKEVLELLNDLNTFDDTQSVYCLQPLILNAKDNAPFEIIDGQQRTTTIYILLKILIQKYSIDQKSLYELKYMTRERSGDFLASKIESIFDLDLSSIREEELADKDYANIDSINALWKLFISQHKAYDYVDVYHFFTVACYAIRWFEETLKDDAKRNRFIDILLNKVHLIWYQLQNDDSGNVIKVFLNNNKGKINLTSSELIKALFILSIKNAESRLVSELQINQFALEWDGIEKQLQDDKFWFFIQSDETLYTEGTRIDYLFDLHFNKNQKKHDSFFSYRMVEKEFNEDSKKIEKNIWEKVVQLYYKLMNWYQDQVLYHLVGYLINAKIKTLSEIITLSANKDKKAFEDALNNTIRQEFATRIDKKDSNSIFKYALDNLHYEDNYDATKKVLLLHNVFYYVGNNAGFKFPFDLYTKNTWSIEHITPQNPKDIQDKDILIQWIKDLYAYRGDAEDTNLINMIEDKSSIKEVYNDKDLQRVISDLALNNSDITHSIANLLLLDKETNSSLGNRLFEEKRKKILEFDKKGKNDDGKPILIPVETLNAFNKTFSSEMNIKNWTKEDGDAYKKSIAERLKDYLPN